MALPEDDLSGLQLDDQDNLPHYLSHYPWTACDTINYNAAKRVSDRFKVTPPIRYEYIQLKHNIPGCIGLFLQVTSTPASAQRRES